MNCCKVSTVSTVVKNKRKNVFTVVCERVSSQYYAEHTHAATKSTVIQHYRCDLQSIESILWILLTRYKLEVG